MRRPSKSWTVVVAALGLSIGTSNVGVESIAIDSPTALRVWGVDGARFTASFPHLPTKDRHPLPFIPPGVATGTVSDATEYTTGPWFTPPPPKSAETDVIAERVAEKDVAVLNRFVSSDGQYTRHRVGNGAVRYQGSISRVVGTSTLWTGFEWIVRGREFLIVTATDKTESQVSSFLNSIQLLDA